MSRGNWVLLVGSAMLAAAVAAMATHEGVRSPEEELHGVQERLQRGRIDREEALDDLDRLVGRTLESGDPTFVARLRLSRGRLLMDIAAWDRARDDLRVALGLGVLDEVDRHEAEDDLIGLHIRAADYDSALNLVKSILDRNPRDGSAWMRSGEIHRAKADIPLASARDLIGSRLVADEALRAEEELDRLAAMDPSDPRRPAAGHALAARFEMGDEDRSLRILRLADAAARENAQARTAFATSLAVKDPRANPSRALSNIIELLDRAGRSEDAAEVGACGTRMMQARGDAAALGMFVDVLEKLGRTGYACDVAKRLVRSRGTIPVDRLLKLTKLFYANERWADLAVATGLLMQEGGTPEAQQAGYYSAMAQVHQGQYSTGLYALQRFLASTTPEPFEGARADAWKMVARAARRLRLADLEREALDTAIRLDRAGSGEEMLRMAGILAVSAHGGYRRPETQLALAMNALPERTEELFPMWTRYGQKSLEEVGLSAADVLTNDNWNRVLSGGSDASVYELYTVGRVLVYLGQAARAEFFVKKIRILVPNFVPGLDLWIRTMQKLHRKADLADALLLRMDLAGTDAETRRILATLSPRTLSAERRIEFMRADPEGFGRREVARGFLGRGRPDLVLDVLGGSEEPNDLPEAREILAAANLALGRPQEAYAALLTEGDDSGSRTPATATGTELFARAALLSGHRKALEIAATRTARSLVPRRSAWLRLSDLMISHGAIEAARPLVRRLDTSPRTRGGDVLLRLGWIQLLSGDFTGLEQTLVRADAFDTQGEADLLALLACADAATWSRLPEAVARVKAGGWRPTRIQRTALQILDQQPQIARALIDEALAQRPDDPLWILADRLSRAEGATNPSLPSEFGPDAETEMARFFGGTGRIDPRTFACMLTVLDDPKASGWIEAKVRVRLGKADGGLWDLWLMTRLAHVRGDRPSERARLEHLLHRFPGFGPAWDRLEEFARASRLPDDGIVSLRERRLHALGERSGTKAERWFDIGRIQRRDGDLDGALVSLARAAQLAPSLPGLTLELGRTHAQRGEWREAVRALVEASDSPDPGIAKESAGDLIEALDRAGQTLPPALPASERASELEALAKRLPDDPRVPVAQARLDLERDPRNPGVAVSRGYARLQRFLNQHKDSTLESLAPGSSAAWTTYLLDLDPDRARRILERDRARDPSGLASWIQLGRIRQARRNGPTELIDERTDERKDELEIARRMAPLSDVLAAHARVRLTGSPRLQEILRIAREVPASEGRTEPAPELALQLARAAFGVGPNGSKFALGLLNKLAWTAEAPPEVAVEGELLRAEVLLAGAESLRAARLLGEVAARITDPYRATVALTAAGLAERMSQQ